MVDTAMELTGTRPANGRVRALALVFGLTIFLSASLLFSVQPLFTKLILPRLGGSSGVWNTAMVFFQAMLLGGYIYAWAVSKYLPLKAQIVVHALVTLAGFAFLPLAAQGWAVPDGTMPVGWLLALFGASVGVPFFAISANAPLLQSWFARTDHPDAADPYFLYATSNAGSLLVLCAYPFVVEPLLELSGQTGLWSGGYRALLFAIMATGLVAVWRSAGERAPAEVGARADTPDAPLSPRRIAFWVWLAFVPSSLMLGVTTFMTNDIASVPMLWIIPLALYLLTFVIVFARRYKPIADQLIYALPWMVLATMPFIYIGAIPKPFAIGVLVTAVFAISLAFHARLVEDRPNASRLTQFYIFMSLGGVLGGVFNALVAPVIFSKVHEFTLVLLLAALLVGPGERVLSRDEVSSRTRALAVAALAAVGAVVAHVLDWPQVARIAFVLLAGQQVLSLIGVRMVARIAVLFAIAMNMIRSDTYQRVLLSDRSFYSTLWVYEGDEEGLTAHNFVHGNTVHNIQLRDTPELRRVPLAYYADGGTFHTALEGVRAGLDRSPAVTVIGLGAGAMACQEDPGERWTYMEIDPAVVDMALNPDLFSFVSDCAPGADIRLGDARLTLEGVEAGSQDLLMVDAFSSGSIPGHLVTREAMELYMSRLAPGGVIFFHTSNRSLDVSSVVVRTAEAMGLDTRFIQIMDLPDHPHSGLVSPSEGILIGRADDVARVAGGDARWARLEPAAGIRAWTDAYSPIIGPMLSALRGDKTVVAAGPAGE